MFSCCRNANSVVPFNHMTANKFTSVNNLMPVIKVLPYNHSDKLICAITPYCKQVETILSEFGIQTILDNDIIEIVKVEHNITVKVYCVKKGVSKKTNYVYNSTLGDILIQIDYTKIYSYV